MKQANPILRLILRKPNIKKTLKVFQREKSVLKTRI